jgi:hypothetical protein
MCGTQNTWEVRETAQTILAKPQFSHLYQKVTLSLLKWPISRGLPPSSFLYLLSFLRQIPRKGPKQEAKSSPERLQEQVAEGFKCPFSPSFSTQLWEILFSFLDDDSGQRRSLIAPAGDRNGAQLNKASGF